MREVRSITVQTWRFSTPFFASRGYILHEQIDGDMWSGLTPTVSPAAKEYNSYPLSQRLTAGNDYPELDSSVSSIKLALFRS